MRLCVAVIMFVVVSVVLAADVTWKIMSPQEQMLWNLPHTEGKNSDDDMSNNPDEQTGADYAQDRSAPRLKLPHTQQLATVNKVGGPQSREDVNENEKEDPQEEANRIQRKANIIQWVIAAFTGALVVIGIIVGCLQMKIMARQTVYMRDATQYAGDAAVAAKNSADAAKNSADAALLQTKIMENRERPWVVVNPIEDLWKEHGPHAAYAFKWVAENVGSSPAFLTELTGEVRIVPVPIRDEPPHYPEKGPFAPFIISPQRIHQSEERGVMSPSDFGELMGGKKALAFYGTVTYHGTFSGPHHTAFYIYWVVKNGSLIYFPVGPPQTIDYT